MANSDWSVNSPSNPAQGPVAIFLTGLGQTNPASSDGAINRPPLAQPVIVPDFTFTGNFSATVAFLGAAAFEVAGVSQLNIIPSGPLTPNLSDQFFGFSLAIGATGVTVYVAP